MSQHFFLAPHQVMPTSPVLRHGFLGFRGAQGQWDMELEQEQAHHVVFAPSLDFSEVEQLTDLASPLHLCQYL